jgi:hypothetical protein
MNHLDRLYYFVMSQLTPEEISAISQSTDNIPIVIANKALKELNKQTKNGRDYIHRIGHKGQSILRGANRIGSSTIIFFGKSEERENDRGNQKDRKTRKNS